MFGFSYGFSSFLPQKVGRLAMLHCPRCEQQYKCGNKCVKMVSCDGQVQILPPYTQDTQDRMVTEDK